MQQRHAVIDFIVGLFIIIACISLIFLAFRVSGLQTRGDKGAYTVTAQFANIGSLKVRAPVQISGVKIGHVTAIDLDRKTFRAVVTLTINHKYNNIPENSTANIYTFGLLGSNYVSISPGYSEQNLKNGSVIAHTNSALILENLIGQFLFSLKGSNDSNQPSSAAAKSNDQANSYQEGEPQSQQQGRQGDQQAKQSPLTIDAVDLSSPASNSTINK